MKHFLCLGGFYLTCLLLFSVGCERDTKLQAISFKQDNVNINCKSNHERSYCKFSTSKHEFCTYHFSTHEMVIPCEFYGDL